MKSMEGEVILDGTSNDEKKCIKKEFLNTKVIVDDCKSGNQPAIFIIENEKVYMITITSSHSFRITDEGLVGERYDENGKWC